MTVRIEPLRFGFFNCYLLTGENGSVLVDTAMPKNREQLLAQVKGGNVRLILLTHGHLDHAGNAAYLADKLGVPIAMGEADFPLIASNKLILNTDALVAKMIRPYFKFVAKRNKIEHFNPIFIKDGDNLTDYGVDGTIIALPGHTAGSIGVLLDDGRLISGDATTNVFYLNKAELYVSAKKILEMSLNMIYPGHGDTQTLEDVEKIMQWQ